MGEELIDISGVWPQWHTVEVIGRGSYGSVYRIEKDDYGIVTSSALKVVSIPHDEDETRELESSGMDEGSIRTFYQSRLNSIANEIRTMESLKSAPKVVSIEDYFIEEMKDRIGWRIYIRMELLRPLTDYIKEKGMLTEQEVVDIGADICTALSYCEKQNIIHRDIKPSNIFLDKFGSYKLGDFGIAKQLSQGANSLHSVRGTSKYMAPEVMRGDKYNGRVDIYSLGILMYRYLNFNRYPFEPPADQALTQKDIDDALRRRMSGENIPLPGGCPSELGLIVVKACQADPAKRYAHASEMLEDLRKYSQGTHGAAPAAGNGAQESGFTPSGQESAPASGGYEGTTGNGTGGSSNYGSDNGGYVHGAVTNYGSDNGGYAHGAGTNYGSDNGGYIHGAGTNYGSDNGGYVHGTGSGADAYNDAGGFGVNYGGYGNQASSNYSDNGTNYRAGGGGYGNQASGGGGYGNQASGGGGYGNQASGGSGYGNQAPGGSGYGNQAPGGSGYGNQAPGSNGYGNQAPAGGGGKKKSGVPAGIIVLVSLLLIGGIFFAFLGITGLQTPAENRYKVVYDASGGTGTMQTQELSKKRGGTLNKNTFSYEGMHFGGWGYSADAEDPDLEDGAKITSEALKEHAKDDKVTLYALWNKDKSSKGNSELGKNITIEKYPLLSAMDNDENEKPACVYLTVRNDNKSEVSVTVEIRYYGKDETVKDTKEVNIEHLAAGEQKLAFSNCDSTSEKIKSVDCEVYAWPERTDPGYTSADDLDITIEEEKAKRTRDSATFKITNRDSREAHHVEVGVLGIDEDGKLFGGGYNYSDDLEPGKSLTFTVSSPIEISENDTFITGFYDGLNFL